MYRPPVGLSYYGVFLKYIFGLPSLPGANLEPVRLEQTTVCLFYFIYIFLFWLRVLDKADYTIGFSVHVKVSILSYRIVFSPEDTAYIRGGGVCPLLT